MRDATGHERTHHRAALPRQQAKDRANGTLELATTTRHCAVSDLNDRYPHDDADVIEIKQAIALLPIDLTRVAAHIMRIADDDVDRGVCPNAPAPPSSGTRDLAAMAMFDLGVER
jgi:hypothetical protein